MPTPLLLLHVSSSIWCFPPSLMGILHITGNVWKRYIFTDKHLWFGFEAEQMASKCIFLSSKGKELLLFPFQKLPHPSILISGILTSPLLFRCGVWAALYCLGNALNTHLHNACCLPVCIGLSNSARTKLFKVVKSEPWKPPHGEMQKGSLTQAVFLSIMMHCPLSAGFLNTRDCF